MSPNALNLTKENQKKSYCYKQKNIFNRRKETWNLHIKKYGENNHCKTKNTISISYKD